MGSSLPFRSGDDPAEPLLADGVQRGPHHHDLGTRQWAPLPWAPLRRPPLAALDAHDGALRQASRAKAAGGIRLRGLLPVHQTRTEDCPPPGGRQRPVTPSPR
eukprot:scaffold21841_cov155-Isochrysis_galbana.AAC.2